MKTHGKTIHLQHHGQQQQQPWPPVIVTPTETGRIINGREVPDEAPRKKVVDISAYIHDPAVGSGGLNITQPVPIIIIYPEEKGMQIGPLYCRDATAGDAAWLNEDPSGKRWLSLQTSCGDEYEIVKRSDSYDHALGMHVGSYGDRVETINANITSTLQCILDDAGVRYDEDNDEDETVEIEPPQDDKPVEAVAKKSRK